MGRDGASCSSVSCRWVVEAGCRRQVRASATWVRMAPSRMESMSLVAAARPPLTPKETTPQVPRGMYFCARAW